jgi:hypothetical protein
MAMKLLCPDADMPELVRALYLDAVPAVLMERTGPGWRVEFMRPAATTPHVDDLIDREVVQRG